MSLSVHGGYNYHAGYPTPGYSPSPEYYHHSQYPPQARYDAPPPPDGYMSWMLNPNHGIHEPTPIDCSSSYGPAQPELCGIPQYDFYGNIIQFRGVKRRVTANKKERRRTESINSAFAQLRGCIPNVPSDTKLSKIKTLRLATSYISYLMELLAKDDPVLENAFKADIQKKRERRTESSQTKTPPTLPVRSLSDSQAQCESLNTLASPITIQCYSHASNQSLSSSNSPDSNSDPDKKGKGGRTGWPQTVWASELK